MIAKCQHLFWRSAILMGMALIPEISTCHAQDAAKSANGKDAEIKQRRDEFRRVALEMARRYRFTTTGESKTSLKLIEQPVLYWTNPIGGDWDGDVFLWNDGKRPAVIVSIHKAYHREGMPVSHEFHALSTKELQATVQGNSVRQTQGNSITWRPMPSAPEPGATATRRGTQMRALARTAAVKKIDHDGTPRNLRLQTKPVYRYDSNADDVLDGGVFVFTQATDPEVVMLIEARRSAGKSSWHVAFAKMNSVDFRAFLGETEVWHAPAIPWKDTLNRGADYTIFYRQ